MRYSILCTLVVIVLGSIYIFVTQTLFMLNSTIAIVSRLAIILFSVITLNSTIFSEDHNILTLRIFWFTTGFIVYCAGNVFVLGFFDYIVTLGVAYFILIWSINWILDIVGNGLFCVGIFLKNK